VPGRSADEPGEAAAVAVLAHVQAHEPVLAAEQRLGERAGELGLADAGGPEEQERPRGAVGPGEPGPAAAHRVRDRGHRLVLADDAAGEPGVEVQQRRGLARLQPRGGDTGAAGHGRGDVVRGEHGPRAPARSAARSPS
jgi:hypothetical protein